jgi:pantetheine-phosphate adenylyltransferase
MDSLVKSTSKAVYGATFDPITLGHRDAIVRASRLFSWVYVLIAVNPNKKPFLTIQEREILVRNDLADIPNVSVHVHSSGYLTDFAQSHSAQVIVRGVRNTTDFLYEQELAHEYRRISQGGVDVMFLPASLDLTYVSSSVVRGHLMLPGGFKHVQELVTEDTAYFLKQKLVEQEIRDAYSALMEELKITKPYQEALQDLVDSYMSLDRRYHSLTHIAWLLQEEKKIHHLLKNPLAFRLAIFYHDVVQEYVLPEERIVSDEEQSILRMREALSPLGVQEGILVYASEMILASAHRDHASSINSDCDYFADIDLAVLGQDRSTFDEYNEGVAYEWRSIPVMLFRKGRRQVLEGLLALGDRLFVTEYGKCNYLEQALVNLVYACDTV